MFINRSSSRLLNQDEEEEVNLNFNSEILPILNENRTGTGDESTQFIYDLETLEAYISFIKKEMSALNVQKKGIRITLGKYPETSEDERINPLYLGRQMAYISAENMDLGEVGEGREKRTLSERIAGIPSLNFGGICPP